MYLPAQVEIREVGLRDGLQAEKRFLPTEEKIELINRVYQCGIKMIEATSFVNPKAIPQLKDAEAVIAAIQRPNDLTVSALVGNARGIHRAIKAQVDEVQVVISASEEHNQRNVNMSIAQSLAQLRDMIPLALEAGLVVRTAIATAFGCPFEGQITVQQLLTLVQAYKEMGVKQITLADTAGLGNPHLVYQVVQKVQDQYPELEIVLHFHDTRGLGLANALAGMQAGVTLFESALGGLGGCPFIPNATGNIATEDLLFLCEEMGVQTGVDQGKLLNTASWLEERIGRQLPGRMLRVKQTDCG